MVLYETGSFILYHVYVSSVEPCQLLFTCYEQRFFIFTGNLQIRRRQCSDYHPQLILTFPQLLQFPSTLFGIIFALWIAVGSFRLIHLSDKSDWML